MQKYRLYSRNIICMESVRLISVPSSKRPVKTKTGEKRPILLTEEFQIIYVDPLASGCRV